MQYFIKRAEATAYPNGTRFKSKKTGAEYIIEKQCGCGEFLHYDVKRIRDSYRYGTVWQHPDIERLCDIELPKEEKVKKLLKKVDEANLVS